MIPLPPAFLCAPIAHRGLHDVTDGRPENSGSAFQAAIDRGYGIEIDVQLTEDDQAVVFHDYELDRLTGETGSVRQRSAADMAGITLTGGSDRVPGFAEVLDMVAGQVPLLVEIKDQDGALGADVGPLEAAVAGALGTYNGPVAVMSFNPESVAVLAKLLPTIPRGLVTCAFRPGTWPVPDERLSVLAGIPDYDRVGASFISHDVHDLDNGRVAALKASGAHVLCWTVRSPEDETRARAIAENITFEGYLPSVPS